MECASTARMMEEKMRKEEVEERKIKKEKKMIVSTRLYSKRSKTLSL